MKNKGFSLIELLLVLGIIAVLIGIMLPRIDAIRAKSRDQKRLSDVARIQIALAQYFNREGYYPATLSLLTSAIPPSVDPFLKELPKDPTTNTDYLYFAYAPSTDPAVQTYCIGYHLATTLEQNDSELNKDSDFNGRDAGVTPPCTGSSQDGIQEDDNGGGCLGGEGYCYDVKK